MSGTHTTNGIDVLSGSVPMKLYPGNGDGLAREGVQAARVLPTAEKGNPPTVDASIAQAATVMTRAGSKKRRE